jgi:transcriptional regulator with XRE-family HTH domain
LGGLMSTPFGTLLRELREARGWTQNKFAVEGEFSPSTINRIESGERGVPEPETVQRMADVLSLRGEQRDAFFDSAITTLTEKATAPYRLAKACKPRVYLGWAEVDE